MLHVVVYAHKHYNVLGSKHAIMKTVAIISQKGGAGKTTIAIHLAVAAEQRGLRTAVFDLDVLCLALVRRAQKSRNLRTRARSIVFQTLGTQAWRLDQQGVFRLPPG
jgi:Mrp family chromosome partitioning ATPase